MEEDERVARENREVEDLGRAWAGRSDEFLVGYVSQQRPSAFHTPALVEIQRRLGDAVRRSSEAADRQAKTEQALNRRIFWLTVATTALAVVQTTTALWPFLSGWIW
jgi:hypothetical protein